MLVEAAHRLNVKTLILDAPGSPAKQINALHAHVDGSFASADSIREIAARCDVLTYEIEHIDTKVLEELDAAGTVEVRMKSSWGGGKAGTREADSECVCVIATTVLENC